ncbi:hypothetical protein [Archaeoglobus fulgidus]|nr:hypothetical protein [Archaeoglobus fulgidus]
MTTNLDVLKQFDSVISELNTYRDPFRISDKLAERMLELSENLKIKG